MSSLVDIYIYIFMEMYRYCIAFVWRCGVVCFGCTVFVVAWCAGQARFPASRDHSILASKQLVLQPAGIIGRPCGMKPAAATTMTADAPCLDDPDVALVLRAEWAEKILSGSKTMELRGTSTSKRCHVAIAVAGTGQLVGQVRIADSVLLACRNPKTKMLEDIPPYGLEATQDMHLVEDPAVLNYKKVYGWRLEDVQAYDPPRDYRHTRGCVGWVRLRSSVAVPKKTKAKVLKRPSGKST